MAIERKRWRSAKLRGNGKQESSGNVQLERLRNGGDAICHIKTDDPEYQEKVADSYLLYILYGLVEELVYNYKDMTPIHTNTLRKEILETFRRCSPVMDKYGDQVKGLFEYIIPLNMMCSACKVKSNLSKEEAVSYENKMNRLLKKEAYETVRDATEYFLARDYSNFNKSLGAMFDEYIRASLTEDSTLATSALNGTVVGESRINHTVDRSKFYISGDKLSPEYMLASAISYTGTIPSPYSKRPIVNMQVSTDDMFSRMRYRMFYIPKQDKSKVRLIAAPKNTLKYTQKRIVNSLYEVSTFDKNLLAYLPGKDYVKQLGEEKLTQKYMMNFDIKNFFYTIDNHKNPLRVAIGEMTRDLTGKYVHNPNNELFNNLAYLMMLITASPNSDRTLSGEAISKLTSMYEAYTYRLCKSMYRYVTNFLGKAINRSSFNKTIATNIIFNLLTVMSSIRLRNDILREKGLAENLIFDDAEAGSHTGISVSQCLDRWLINKLLSNIDGDTLSYFMDGNRILDIANTAGAFSLCNFLTDIDKKLILTPVVRLDVMSINPKTSRTYTKSVVATDYYTKVCVLGYPVTQVYSGSEIGTMVSRWKLSGGTLTSKLLHNIYCRVERFCATSIPTKADTMLTDLLFKNDGTAIGDHINSFTSKYGPEVVDGSKINYAKLCNRPNFKFSEILRSVYQISRTKRLIGWRTCVPQGAPTSGIIVNYLNRHLLENLRSVINTKAGVRNAEVFIYSDNIYVFYDLPEGVQGPDAVRYHKEVQYHVNDTCSTMGLPTNKDKETFFIEDKKLLGIIMDKEGSVRVSRLKLREANQIIINLNKREEINYKGVTYTRSGISRVRGLINWINRGDTDKYPRKIVPIEFLDE